jgi:hypothetical protein
LPDGRIMIPRKRAARAGDIGASQVQIGGSRHESEPRKDACSADQLCLPIREEDARRAADLDLRELRRRTSLIVRRQTCRRTVHRFAAPSYTARTGTEREGTPNRAGEGASHGIGKSEGWYAGGRR